MLQLRRYLLLTTQFVILLVTLAGCKPADKPIIITTEPMPTVEEVKAALDSQAPTAANPAAAGFFILA